MTNYRESMSQTLEYMAMIRERKILERELTDTELKRREEIAKDLPDAEFKDRYGDKWMEVKMATATKICSQCLMGMGLGLKRIWRRPTFQCV